MGGGVWGPFFNLCPGCLAAGSTISAVWLRADIPTASHMPTAARAMGLVSAPSAGEDERALDKAVESGDSGEQRLLCF